MSATQEQNDGTVSEIQNKAQKPPGVSAKNKQTLLMLLAGGAIVLVIALSNSSSSSTPKPKTPGSATPANPATPKAIQEYARQLDDNVRNLAQERARADEGRRGTSDGRSAESQTRTLIRHPNRLREFLPPHGRLLLAGNRGGSGGWHQRQRSSCTRSTS